MLDRARLFPRTLKPLALGLALTAALAASACTKTEGQSSASNSGTATSAPSATPSGATTTTTPAIDASPSTIAPDTSAGITPGGSAAAPVASATGATKTTVASGASGAVAASASASATAGAAQCGTKPLPDCPLQAWMKANTNPAIASSDLPGLATALDKTAGFAPAGYANWASISKDGAKAARGGDMTAAKASCRTCHDQYKDKYKKEMRARKI